MDVKVVYRLLLCHPFVPFQKSQEPNPEQQTTNSFKPQTGLKVNQRTKMRSFKKTMSNRSNTQKSRGSVYLMYMKEIAETCTTKILPTKCLSNQWKLGLPFSNFTVFSKYLT